MANFEVQVWWAAEGDEPESGPLVTWSGLSAPIPRVGEHFDLDVVPRARRSTDALATR